MGLPRVQAVQTMVRLIYDDGTVAAVATEAQDVQRDDLEITPIHVVGVTRQAMTQFTTIRDRIVQEGFDSLFQQAKAETADRRRGIGRRALKAFDRQRQAGPNKGG
jgi:hypothetical protein